MSAKLKNTIIVLVILIAIAVGGGLFNYVYLKNKIENNEKKTEFFEIIT